MTNKKVETVEEADNIEIILKKYSKYYDFKTRSWNISWKKMQELVAEISNVSKDRVISIYEDKE